MEDYPTEEEMAELQELYDQPSVMQPSSQIPSQKHTPASNRNEHSFFHNNSQLSQITTNDTAVNRRLFGTPLNSNSNQSNRVASTPFAPNIIDSPFTQRFQFDDDEFEENNQRATEFNGRKRRLNDLFGDINDIIQEENVAQVFYSEDPEENAKKKARSEEEADNELIQRILFARAENLARANHITQQSKLKRLEELQSFKQKNLSESYPKWPSIPVVNGEDSRIYIRMHSEEFESNQLNELSIRKNISNLLGNSTENMWTEAEKIVEQRMTAPSQAIQSVADDEIRFETNPNAGKLWVEKYRPKSYLDLLSDESTNRSLLTWLKMWDKIVFNRNFQTEKDLSDAQKQSASNFNKKTGRFESGNVRFRKYRQNDLKMETDSYGRPVQKIAVLCGPPGLGKTTLAHTIARHAGYSVREINASDDRSPEAFKLALQNGTEMQTTLLDQDQRPNCIILDEIDGAPLASIEFLIRFANDQTKENKKQSKTAFEKKGKKPNGILRRPIICICNDIYTPSLRPLRQIAFIVTFPQLDSSRLAERLLTIARREKLKTDMTTLLALAEKSGNDVRSCISVLQFFANSRKPLELIDVMKSNVGDKDKQKGLFEIWSAVFQIQRTKEGLDSTESKAISNGLNDSVVRVISTDTSLRKRVEHVLNTVHLGGDSDRLINGVFENYLTQKMPDGNFVGIAAATEWFCFEDLLQAQIQSQQNYAIYPYLSYGFVAWHLLFAGIAWAKIVFPTQGFEYYQKSSTQKSIRTSFVKNMSVSVRSLNSSIVISEAIPPIRQILCPSLRSVSLQLLTPKEKYDLHHTVEVMVDLGLTYSQTKNVDGTYQYQIDPDINFLCNFKLNERTNELTYSNMQIIAREVELETMRRSAPKQSDAHKATVSRINNNKNGQIAKPKPQNHLQWMNIPFSNEQFIMIIFLTF